MSKRISLHACRGISIDVGCRPGGGWFLFVPLATVNCERVVGVGGGVEWRHVSHNVINAGLEPGAVHLLQPEA